MGGAKEPAAIATYLEVLDRDQQSSATTALSSISHISFSVTFSIAGGIVMLA